MAAWFLFDRGQKSGPFPTSVVVHKVVSRELSNGALVWKEGMQEWQPLLAHFKAPPEPIESERGTVLAEEQTATISKQDETSSTRSATSVETAQKQNFLCRYWRGNFSLPVSYWIVGFVGSFIILALILLLQGALRQNDYDPNLIILSIAGSWFIAGAWGVFQLVGTWRAAARYRNEKGVQHKHSFWGVLAQVAVIGGAFVLTAAFAKVGLPQLSESWKIAFQNDPSTPDYTLRVMRNGTELEIAGGFKYGLANDFDKVLSASPQIKVVHLNSNGGRVGEAEKLSRIIRSRNLSTYTSSQCLSACTIAFAAGRERWLNDRARLGYHGGAFAGQDYPEIMRNALLRAGYDASFVARAVSYPSTQMWYPTVPELKAAQVISGTADDYRFAASGYGMKPGTEDFEKELRRHSLFRTIEQAAPRVFRELAEQFQRGYVQGVPEGPLLDQIRESRIIPLVTARLTTADNRTAADYASLLADQYEALGSKDSKLCYDFAVKGATTTIVNAFAADIRNREVALTERVLTASHSGPKRTSDQLASLYGKVVQKLTAQYGAESVAMLDSSQIKPSQYPLYCRLLTGMFREISRLAVADAGDVMRDIFSGMAATQPKK